ncbi:hypothetical protein Tco_0878050 [Tanacetum coccineum]|uniref:Uncharacterized protein n=1 Tax=Tanacetum coccineum TaxID=301880 RepID=A0ABQ5C2P1_9ASTR
MHNNIMAAGSRDRPPMLATGRYAQCRDSYEWKERAHFESEKEAVHMILTRIGDEIYYTVDAYNTAHEM